MLQAMSASTPGVTYTSSTTIDELVLADEPERWSALGFTVLDDRVQLGSVSLFLAGQAAGRGVVGWSLRGLTGSDLDGLPTTSSQSQSRAQGVEHANGITAIDHVVAMTPNLDRSVAALRSAGLDLRRVREQPTPAGAPRQAFFRLGAEILEVVQEPEQIVARHGEADRGARLWGLALLAADLDRTVTALAPHAGAVRDAVQPGRRIATIKRSAGLSVPVALMSPQPAS